MKKILSLIICLAFGGCAQLQTLTTLATTSVTPTQAIVAANAFDGIEAGATGYLTYCKSNANVDASCSAANRRSVIQYTRSGRAARNQIETYVSASTSIPSALYNTLVTAVNNLKASPAANYAGAQ
jgi:hypothetical protein